MACPDRLIEQGLDLDQVGLIPAYSQVKIKDIQLNTNFTAKIPIKIPFVAGPLKNVSESRMAIAIARLGGIAIIHKNMSVQRQAEQVDKVKKAQQFIIQTPYSMLPQHTVGQALALMKQKGINGIPITDNSGKLLGIVTNRDIRFESNMSKPLERVMTKQNLITAPPDISEQQAQQLFQKYKIEKLPVTDQEGKLIGLITYKDLLNRKKYPLATIDDKGRLRVAAAVGIGSDTLRRINELIKVGADAIVLETMHAHTKVAINTIKMIRYNFGDEIQIVAGNIATAQAALDLINAGANAIKIGMSASTSSLIPKIAGVQVPLLTAICEISKALEKSSIPILVDAGIRNTGDIVKALAAGASAIVLSKMLIGAEETPGKTIIINGKKYKLITHSPRNRVLPKDPMLQITETQFQQLIPDDTFVKVPYKGTVAEMINQIMAGIKIGMIFVGAQNIKQLRKARFIQISPRNNSKRWFI